MSAPADELAERAVTVAMVLMTYVGLYVEDPEEATNLLAMDSTMQEMIPTADAQLGVMMALSWLAAAADLDTVDIRQIAQSIIDGMIAGQQEATS